MSAATAKHGHARSPLLSAALGYAALGWRVVPLHPCDKRPRPNNWPNVATDDADMISRWWCEVPTGNVGVALGSGSGIVGVDVDTEEGSRLLQEMAGGDLPPTCEMTTGKGSRLLFTIPDALEVEPRTVPIKGTDGSEAVRFQGKGGQCVMPPSIHPTGKQYAWVEGRSPDDLPPAPMPGWLIVEMARPKEAHWQDPQKDGPAECHAPGADYNRRGSWSEMLVANGFKPAGGRGDVKYFTRPGKTSGVSATVGHYKAKDGTPALYVFSGSIPTLPAEKCYDLFGAFARLEHGGNFAAASRALASKGFGVPRPRATFSSNGDGTHDQATGELVIARLSDLKARPVRYLVPSRIALGKVTLIGGRGGSGKSTLTRSLAAAVSRGRPAFGLTYTATGCKVLIVAAEDGPEDTILPSLLAEGADLDRVALLEGIRWGDKRTPFALLPEHVELVRQRLLQSPEIRLIIIDPIASFVGRAKIDDHRATELRLVLDPLNELAESTGAAILILAHLNKSSGDAVDRIAGSAAYRDAVRAAYLVGEDPKDETRRLFVPIKENLPGFDRTSIPFRLQVLADGDASGVLQAPQFGGLDDEGRSIIRHQLRRVTFDVPCTANANEMMKQKKEDKSKVQRCAEWLKTFLREFAFPSAEIVAAAEKAGFTFDNVKTAKTKLKDEGLRNSNLGRFRGDWWSGFGEPGTWTLRPEPAPGSPKSPDTPHSPESPHITN